VRLVRDIERRLEQLVEGVAGRVFKGTLHPSELVARLVREADLARVDGPNGPVAPNVYAIHLSPKDVGEIDLPEQLNRELEAAVELEAATRGWRLEGPATVWIESQDSVGAGRVAVVRETRPGKRDAWAKLVSVDGEYDLTRNRCVIGRGSGADTIIPSDIISRRHAMIWMEGGAVWVADLRSANGTFVDGIPAAAPIAIVDHQRLVLGTLPLRFELVD
jgi:hypothetical protein